MFGVPFWRPPRRSPGAEPLPAIYFLSLSLQLVRNHLRFLAVFADARNAAAEGAPLAPGFRIVSPRARLALMFAYRPGLLAIEENLYWLRDISVVILVSNPEFNHRARRIVKQDRGGLWPVACDFERLAES